MAMSTILNLASLTSVFLKTLTIWANTLIALIIKHKLILALITSIFKRNRAMSTICNKTFSTTIYQIASLTRWAYTLISLLI